MADQNDRQNGHDHDDHNAPRRRGHPPIRLEVFQDNAGQPLDNDEDDRRGLRINNHGHAAPLAAMAQQNPNFVRVVFGTSRYTVLRAVLTDNLPRTAMAGHTRFLLPCDLMPRDLSVYLPLPMRPRCQALIYSALDTLFHHLERLSSHRGGGSSLYDTLSFRLTQSPALGQTTKEMLELAIAICLVLDSQHGLGASAGLAESMGDFMVCLAGVVRSLSGPEDNSMRGLVVAFTRIFTGSAWASDQMWVLWDYLEPTERRDVEQLVRGHLEGPVDGPIARFVNALDRMNVIRNRSQLTGTRVMDVTRGN